MKAKLAVLVTALALVCVIAYAQTTNSNYGAQGGQNWVVGGVLTRSGTGYDLISARADVTVTTATATFSAAGKGYITLRAYSALTEVAPTGGTLGQRIEVLSYDESSSNTMRFDDKTGIELGSDITLTPGQNDILCLECTNAAGTTWIAVYEHQN
jgi:hypothetical protein